MPRVAGHTEQGAGGVAERTELGRRGLADRDRPGRSEPFDVDVVTACRGSVGVPPRAPSGWHAGAVLEVLHAERHAGERAELLAVAAGTVDGVGSSQGTVDIDVHPGVQGVLRGGDPVERSLHELAGGDLPVADQRRRGDHIGEGIDADHRPIVCIVDLRLVIRPWVVGGTRSVTAIGRPDVPFPWHGRDPPARDEAR